MDRGTWRAAVQDRLLQYNLSGIARIGHDLATKPPPPCKNKEIVNKEMEILKKNKK